MMWREIDNFSSGSVCMVLASGFFDESDYFRQYKDFLEAVKNPLMSIPFLNLKAALQN